MAPRVALSQWRPRAHIISGMRAAQRSRAHPGTPPMPLYHTGACTRATVHVGTSGGNADREGRGRGMGKWRGSGACMVHRATGSVASGVSELAAMLRRRARSRLRRSGRWRGGRERRSAAVEGGRGDGDADGLREEAGVLWSWRICGGVGGCDGVACSARRRVCCGVGESAVELAGVSGWRARRGGPHDLSAASHTCRRWPAESRSAAARALSRSPRSVAGAAASPRRV